MTTKTVETEVFPEMDDMSDDDELVAEEKPAWVDKVKLRHGMDWLDLIAKEVDVTTARAENKYRKSNYTEATQ